MGWSLNMEGTSALTRQHPSRRLFIKRHHLLQMRRPNHGVDLGRIDARMPEQGPNLFQVMLLLQHFHRDPMTQIKGLASGTQ